MDNPLELLNNTVDIVDTNYRTVDLMPSQNARCKQLRPYVPSTDLLPSDRADPR